MIEPKLLMESKPLTKPKSWQRPATGAAEYCHHVAAKPGRILGTEARHCKSIPGGQADLAAERFRQLANSLQQRLIARHDQRGADRYAAFGDRGPRQFFGD